MSAFPPPPPGPPPGPPPLESPGRGATEGEVGTGKLFPSRLSSRSNTAKLRCKPEKALLAILRIALDWRYKPTRDDNLKARRMGRKRRRREEEEKRKRERRERKKGGVPSAPTVCQKCDAV